MREVVSQLAESRIREVANEGLGREGVHHGRQFGEGRGFLGGSFQVGNAGQFGRFSPFHVRLPVRNRGQQGQVQVPVDLGRGANVVQAGRRQDDRPVDEAVAGDRDVPTHV